ncbi:MAG: HEAT repeat domain-containing protein [Planctomycetota bacterium]|jgi:hypothetical protein
MIVYHGTTARRARRICAEGFLPKKPSRRVWFAEGHGYALRRAKTQARRSHDKPVVLTCDVNLPRLRERLGPKRVFRRNGVVAINAKVGCSVLRSYPSVADQPASPEELAAWVNRVLGVKSYKGVGRRHDGIKRLSRWVVNRMGSEPRGRISPGELLEMARRWLPEFFEDVRVDPESLRAYPKVHTIEVVVDSPDGWVLEREDEALELLVDPSPKRRAKGLRALAKLADPDLFEWCVMCLEDEALEVRVAALETALGCADVDAGTIEPLAEAEDARVRAAALAALAKHGRGAAPRWFRRGLEDPEPRVRLAVAKLLAELDPKQHRTVFELALYDPNPDVARRAKALAAGKDYSKVALRAGGRPRRGPGARPRA